MNIFCHIPREDWICDRIGSEYKSHSSHTISSDQLNSNTDVVWLLAAWCWNQIPQKALISKKVVCTIHHEVPEKFDKNRLNNFLMRDQFVDMYHVPCQKTHDFIRNITSKPISILSYWVNPELWKFRNKNEMKKKYGISDSELSIGSFQRDTEGHDLKTPKLEKGPDRFCQFVEKLKDSGENVHVLLNGWRRQYVINRLKSSNIKYTYIELPPIETVSEMYSACDLYVVGSRWEGGPQSILECAISKVPIVSTDVGIASNILPNSCIIDMSKDFIPYIPTGSDVEYCFNQVQGYLLTDYYKKYDELFDQVLRM
jgi:glycosyltransferase involved in cell wall biosynthesis